MTAGHGRGRIGASLRKVGLLVLIVAAVAGCREDPSDSAEEFRQKLDSTGRRVLVVGADGQPLRKLRARTDSYKVYDESLAPVGYVRWEDVEDPQPVRARVELRALDKSDPLGVEQVADDSFELAEHFRIERADRGWAVLDAEATLVGIFEREDDSWHLRRGYDDQPGFSVDDSGATLTVVRDGQTELRLQSGDLSALELLAAELDGLGPLEQTAVGVWMQHARPIPDE
ncbi:MAG: hypothetical protein ACLFVJ_12160 [Persicimonas sp.]